MNSLNCVIYLLFIIIIFLSLVWGVYFLFFVFCVCVCVCVCVWVGGGAFEISWKYKLL